jgi:hypothetical protein
MRTTRTTITAGKAAHLPFLSYCELKFYRRCDITFRHLTPFVTLQNFVTEKILMTLPYRRIYVKIVYNAITNATVMRKWDIRLNTQTLCKVMWTKINMKYEVFIEFSNSRKTEYVL